MTKVVSGKDIPRDRINEIVKISELLEECRIMNGWSIDDYVSAMASTIISVIQDKCDLENFDKLLGCMRESFIRK